MYEPPNKGGYLYPILFLAAQTELKKECEYFVDNRLCVRCKSCKSTRSNPICVSCQNKCFFCNNQSIKDSKYCLSHNKKCCETRCTSFTRFSNMKWCEKHIKINNCVSCHLNGSYPIICGDCQTIMKENLCELEGCSENAFFRNICKKHLGFYKTLSKKLII